MSSAVLASLLCLFLATTSGLGLGGLEASPNDDVLLLQIAAGTSRETSPAQEPSHVTKVLVFWAASAKPEIRDLVRRNVEHIRHFEASSRGAFHFDVFLAHYDFQKETWRKELGDWYKENVQFAEEQKGIKFYLAKTMLLGDHPPCKIQDYDWVWVLDDDADLTSTNLQALMEDAEASGSWIVAPSVAFIDQDPSSNASVSLHEQQVGCQPNDNKCHFQARKPECRYRHVNFVEVSFPLLRPKAFAAVLGAKPETVNQRSVWGLDHVWCGLSAQLVQGDRVKSCAIVDRAPIIHRNFKTLPKYKETFQGFTDIFELFKVQGAYKAALAGKLETYKCIPSSA